jgi:hypothetical protein
MIGDFPGRPARLLTALVFALAVFPAPVPGQEPPDAGDQALGLADLPAEHAALAGKATIDGPRAADPPRPLSFPDLWDHPEEWRGRRVIVRGAVARVFRQGAVGSFPPLVEGWLSTPEGNLLCVVFPQPKGPGGDPPLEAGRRVDFTGTFLRPIRYAAADQPRLAPLVVGDRPPAPLKGASAGAGASTAAALRSIGASPIPDSRLSPAADSWPAAGWAFGLILGLAAAAVLAWQHLRGPASVRFSSRQGGDGEDAPPEFLRTEPADGA